MPYIDIPINLNLPKFPTGNNEIDIDTLINSINTLAEYTVSLESRIKTLEGN